MNNVTGGSLLKCSDCESMTKLMSVNWFPGLFPKLVALAILAVLSATANIFLMYIASRTRSKVNNTKVFFISLCSAHLLGSIIVIPTWIVCRLVPELPLRSPAFCQAASFFWILMILASFYSLSALSLDRFFIISNPMRYPIVATTLKKQAAVLLLWIFCILFASSPILGWGEYKFMADAIPICGLNMKYSLSFTVTLIAVGFCAPLLVDILCCGRIISIARRQSRSIEARKGSDGSMTSSMSAKSVTSTKTVQSLPKLSKLKQKINSLRLVFAGTGTFLACWLPYLGAHVWMTTIRNISHHRESMPYILEFVVMCIGLLNGLINPLVIMLCNRDYRREFKFILFRRNRNTDERSDSESTNITKCRRSQFRNLSLSKAFNDIQESAAADSQNDITEIVQKQERHVAIDCVFDAMPPTPTEADILNIKNLEISTAAKISECKRLMSRSTGSSSDIDNSIDLTNKNDDLRSGSCLMKRTSTETQLETMLEVDVINCDETIK